MCAQDPLGQGSAAQPFDVTEGQGRWADQGVTLLGQGVGSSGPGWATLSLALETGQGVARAFLRSSLFLWSMASISRSFCKGHQEKLGVRVGLRSRC